MNSASFAELLQYQIISQRRLFLLPRSAPIPLWDLMYVCRGKHFGFYQQNSLTHISAEDTEQGLFKTIIWDLQNLHLGVRYTNKRGILENAQFFMSHLRDIQHRNDNPLNIDQFPLSFVKGSLAVEATMLYSSVLVLGKRILWDRAE